MTFEEFFRKKKIDLDKLQKERPELFEEFRTHFHAMGEKSFDHTKKYWFNKLRKSYLLKDEPVKAQPVAAGSQPGAASSSGNAATAKAAGDAPAGAGAPPRLGFKPRFKAGKTGVTGAAGSTTPAGQEASGKQQSAATGDMAPGETASGDTTSPASAGNSPASASDSPAPKPAYRPRFQAGKTKTRQAAATPEGNQPTEQSEEKAAAAKESDQPGRPATQTETEGLTKANAGTSEKENTEPVKQGDASPPDDTGKADNPGKDGNTGKADDPGKVAGGGKAGDENSPPAPKPAYKPRFRAGVTKTTKRKE